MRIFLHDEDCNPLGIVTLDWDVEKRGPRVRIPVYARMRSSSYSGDELAHMAQPADNHIMEILLSPIRCTKLDGTMSEGWMGMTRMPELCETFFETKF